MLLLVLSPVLGVCCRLDRIWPHCSDHKNKAVSARGMSEGSSALKLEQCKEGGGLVPTLYCLASRVRLNGNFIGALRCWGLVSLKSVRLCSRTILIILCDCLAAGIGKCIWHHFMYCLIRADSKAHHNPLRLIAPFIFMIISFAAFSPVRLMDLAVLFGMVSGHSDATF